MTLQELQEKLAGRAVLEAELEGLFSQKSALEEWLQREKVNLEYERSDVQDMENGTLKSLFYSVIGKKEERLRKEEDEAEAAERQYEGTLKELEAVNARIKHIEFELRELKHAERNRELFAKELSLRVAEIRPRLSDADAIALESIQKEIAEQEQNQAYFAQITEEGKRVQKNVASVQDALREMLEENRHGTVFGEYERRKEAEERRDQVLIQTQRFLDLIVKSGIKFANEYCIDPANIDNMIRRTVIRCYNNTPNADLFVPDIPDMTVNVAGILDELEKKTERSKRHQAAMELKLSQLLEKYQTM